MNERVEEHEYLTLMCTRGMRPDGETICTHFSPVHLRSLNLHVAVVGWGHSIFVEQSGDHC